MNKAAFPICAFLALSISANAAETISDADRFQLWNNCEPINLFVGGRSDVSEIQKNRFENAIRRKLQTARIYNNNSFDPPTLAVFIYVTDLKDVKRRVRGKLFYNVFAFYKRVTDSQTELNAGAATAILIRGGFSPSTSDHMDFIVSAITDSTDGFIDKYLRANADACQSESPLSPIGTRR